MVLVGWRSSFNDIRGDVECGNCCIVLRPVFDIQRRLTNELAEDLKRLAFLASQMMAISVIT
jgi:hypothetical protein